jgi:hypothetical protein
MIAAPRTSSCAVARRRSTLRSNGRWWTLQAQVRAAQLKRTALAEHLGERVRLVIALPGTRRVRRVVSQLLPLFRTAFTEELVGDLGLHPQRVGIGADGILFVPPVRPRRMA